ncbi:MAG TPA: hypothetical protein VJ739_07840, partial [Gemmataceae bacterium]|nr:hypothetical protein [Gemmataceae bacterium]
MAEQWQPSWIGAPPPGSEDEWEIAPEGLRRRSPLTGIPADNPASAAGPPPDGQAAVPSVVLTVSPAGDADCRSIHEAVLRAPAGARILVRPGTYTEGVVLTKPLEIIGDGPRDQIVLTTPDSHCVSIHTTHAVVRGLTLR